MVHLGPDAFAPVAPEVLSGAASGVFPPPFVKTSAAVETEVSPTFLETFDVNYNGDWGDGLAGSRGIGKRWAKRQDRSPKNAASR
jgi:hypothetical protein